MDIITIIIMLIVIILLLLIWKIVKDINELSLLKDQLEYHKNQIESIRLKIDKVELFLTTQISYQLKNKNETQEKD